MVKERPEQIGCPVFLFFCRQSRSLAAEQKSICSLLGKEKSAGHLSLFLPELISDRLLFSESLVILRHLNILTVIFHPVQISSLSNRAVSLDLPVKLHFFTSPSMKNSLFILRFRKSEAVKIDWSNQNFHIGLFFTRFMKAFSKPNCLNKGTQNGYKVFSFESISLIFCFFKVKSCLNSGLKSMPKNH